MVFQLQMEIQDVAVVVFVPQTALNLAFSHCCYAEYGKEMYEDLNRTCAATILLTKYSSWR